MKIINLKQFLECPPNTVFYKYVDCVFSELSIKMDNCGANDFFYTDLINAIRCDSSQEFQEITLNSRDSSIVMDFDCEERDGIFDEEQLFAIWEKEDVKKLLVRLLGCV